MVTDAVLLVIGVVGMRRTEETTYVLVVLRVLVGVAYLETDRSACRFALEHAAQELHLVGLVSGSGDVALTRATTIQFALHEIHVDFDAGRESIDDTADRHAMAFAECRECKEIAKCISHLDLI